MNQYKHHWNEEDLTLEQDFKLELEFAQESLPKSPQVPKNLDKLIRRQAQLQASSSAQRSFIFRMPIQLTLGVLLLATIGLAFLFSMNPSQVTPKSGLLRPLVVDADWHNQSRLKNYYYVSYQVDQFGRASGIRYLHGCAQTSTSSCGSSSAMEREIRGYLNARQHDEPGKQYRVFPIKPPIKAHKLKQ